MLTIAFMHCKSVELISCHLLVLDRVCFPLLILLLSLKFGFVFQYPTILVTRIGLLICPIGGMIIPSIVMDCNRPLDFFNIDLQFTTREIYFMEFVYRENFRFINNRSRVEMYSLANLRNFISEE